MPNDASGGSSHPTLQGSKKLTGRVGFFGTVGLPLGILAISASALTFPPVITSLVGTAAPLSFVIGLVIGLPIALSFCLFGRRYATCGSIYGFNSTALGSSYGFVSGSTLAMAYLCGTWASALIATSFVNELFPRYAADVPYWVTTVVLEMVGALLAYRGIKFSANLSTVIETTAMVLLAVIGFAVLAHGGARRNSISATPFTMHGLSFGALALGIAITFSAYSGFESSAVLGEESQNPRRAIPQAIVISLLIAGVALIFTSYVLTVGFSSTKALLSSSSPMVELSQRFAGGVTVGKLLLAFAFFSAVGAIPGNQNSAARIIYSFGRDRILPGRLAHTQRQYGTPVGGIAAAVIFGVVMTLALAHYRLATNLTASVSALAVGIIVSYLSSVVAAIVKFWRMWYWTIVLVVTVPVIVYVLKDNIWPLPSSPYDFAIYAAFAWIVLSACALVSRGLRRRLASSETLAVMEGPETREPAAVSEAS